MYLCWLNERVPNQSACHPCDGYKTLDAVHSLSQPINGFFGLVEPGGNQLFCRLTASWSRQMTSSADLRHHLNVCADALFQGGDM